jgi:hypothetical protein
MARNYKQGHYKPIHPEKYIGDLEKIVYRSGWEQKVNKFLDCNVNITHWSSEPFPIKYLKPTDKRIHRYYVDYFVEYRDANGNILRELWEVKPKKETKPPRNSKKKSAKTKLYEDVTYAVNQAKWKAAAYFCKKHNMTFRIMTEDQIFR